MSRFRLSLLSGKIAAQESFLELSCFDWFTLVYLSCGSVLRGTMHIKVVKWSVAGGNCNILQRLKTRYTSLLSLIGFLPALSSSSWWNLPLASIDFQETLDAYLLGIYSVPDTVLALRIQQRNSAPNGFSLWKFLVGGKSSKMKTSYKCSLPSWSPAWLGKGLWELPGGHKSAL